MTVTDITAQIAARDGAAVTVYTRSTPFCGKCVATKRWLTKRGIEFTEVDMATDPSALAWAKSRGHLAAPVVAVSTPAGDVEWSDFRVDLLEQHLGEAAA